MKNRELKKRLRKDRPMDTISLRMPEDVVEDLKLVAPRLGFSGYQLLMRAYMTLLIYSGYTKTYFSQPFSFNDLSVRTGFIRAGINRV